MAAGVALALVLAGAGAGLLELARGALAPQARDTAASFGGPRVLVPSSSPGATSPDPTAAQAQAILAPVAAPVRLTIPAIGVDAPVEQVGTDAQGRMAVPSEPDHVAWYSPGVAPGDVGDAVIDGHLDWTSGPAVFARLGQLRSGDRVVVTRADQSQAVFVVDSTATYAFDARVQDLFTRTGVPSLSLLTCSGPWDRQRGTYLTRLAVHATLAPGPVQSTPGDEGG